jgi:hypothetical protein
MATSKMFSPSKRVGEVRRFPRVVHLRSRLVLSPHIRMGYDHVGRIPLRSFLEVKSYASNGSSSSYALHSDGFGYAQSESLGKRIG